MNVKIVFIITYTYIVHIQIHIEYIQYMIYIYAIIIMYKSFTTLSFWTIFSFHNWFLNSSVSDIVHSLYICIYLYIYIYIYIDFVNLINNFKITISIDGTGGHGADV